MRVLVGLVLLIAAVGCGEQTAETTETSAETADSTTTTVKPPKESWFDLSQIVLQYEGARHAPPEVTRTREEALELAGEISLQIRAGGDFAELARKHSDDSSAPDGGRTGIFPTSQLAPPIVEACKILAVGGVSEPLETKFGFHIIRRESDAEMAAARHILVLHDESKWNPNLERTKEQAEARAREALEKIRSGTDLMDLVIEYSEGTTQAVGGDIGTFPRGISDPAIDEAVFSLEVGEISDVTETPYGFHIFERYE